MEESTLVSIRSYVAQEGQLFTTQSESVCVHIPSTLQWRWPQNKRWQDSDLRYSVPTPMFHLTKSIWLQKEFPSMA